MNSTLLEDNESNLFLILCFSMFPLEAEDV